MSGPLPSFDAIVVGAGPSGSSAAATLAAAGMRVALIDKARFPRDKLCGGLLSERSVRSIRRVFDTAGVPIEVTSHGASVFDRGRRLVRLSHDKPVHFTSRRNFDAALLQCAVARGAKLIEGNGVRTFDARSNTIELEDGRAISASFVVGADGAGSRIRKCIGAAIDRHGFAVGLEAEVPRSAVSRAIADPEIYFGLVEWGYAWIFPKATTLTVGIGGLASRNDDMRARFAQFASIALGNVPAQRLCGSPIPFGNYLRHPGRASTLLVGDAAGLVEPLTGEGIAFAIESGQRAGEAILRAARLRAPDRAYGLYQPGYRQIVSAFRDVRLLRHLVFSGATRHLFLRALQGNERMLRKHLDVLAGDASYRDYARYALGETVRRLPGLCRYAYRNLRTNGRQTLF
jgi:geranylgeranyl reductase family protein